LATKTESCGFATDSCELSTKEIWMLKTLIFRFKLLKIKKKSSFNFCIFERKIPDNKKFSTD